MGFSYDNTPLGKATAYCSAYDPSLLCPISRQDKRDELGIAADALPFVGVDVWTGHELSWLNAKGLPQVAVARFVFDAASPSLVESKSFKLYLNSYRDVAISHEEATNRIFDDLKETLKPRKMEVVGDFNVRGNVKTVIRVAL